MAPRVTAKGDGFTLFVAAVGITAILNPESCKRNTARIDLDTAELDGLRARENRHRPNEFGYMAFARFGRLR